ncbi:DUF1553 domain-containing protein [bacterium]|nr:DUF1553 domain-containing protein [bacterium]
MSVSGMSARWRAAERCCVALVIVMVLVSERTIAAQDAETAGRVAFFESRVRPLLLERCIKCHGPKKSEAGLRLDSLATALKGGDSGPAIDRLKPEASLLLKAVRHEDGLEMPPGKTLDAVDMAALTKWIHDGAAWREPLVAASNGPAVRGGPITKEERNFWSLQPVTDPQPPEVDDRISVRNDIDRFVIARLRAVGLTWRPRADKRTLLRRVTFDLTGLPPTPADLDAFVADESPDALATVVDRLLASKTYGERWGRHWLDVVRYSDTAGETADYPTPLAYRYRNWVIDAFNADMPYDEFIREQIAGDLLAKQLVADSDSQDLSDETLRQYQRLMEATGFIAVSRRFGFDVENYHHLTIQDTIDTLGQSVLGLTLGCARCHDHKYDPVNVADYYGWYGIFESTRYSFPGSEQKKRPYDLFPDVPEAVAAARKTDHDRQLAEVTNQLEEALKLKEESSDHSQRIAELTAKRDALNRATPYGQIYGALDRDAPADAFIQIRGEVSKRGDQVPRRNLEILGADALPDSGVSGRLQLAKWLTRPSNPLTPRVMVNRIWQHHFGRGIVGTENDFGTRGDAPTHPQLLDWLASRFVESGWSVKTIHRLILNSATWQQSNEFDAATAERDPGARLLWRMNPRRLSAEEIRDAMLFVSGDLDATMGGEHPFPPVEQWGYTQHNPFYAVYPSKRRSIYLMQQRLKRHPFLALFDGADPNVSTAHRELTTVPTQSLFLMNNEFVHERAVSLALRVLKESASDAERIRSLFRITLSRLASAEEESGTLAFLSEYQSALRESGAAETDLEQKAWAAFARTLLTRNEFLFVD